MPAAARETRVHSRYTRDAISVLGRMVSLGRKRRRMTAQMLADRVGISRGTLQRLERGDPRVEIGIVFEAAAIVGVALFDRDQTGLAALSRHTDDRLALLPKHVRATSDAVDDDF